MNIYRNKKGELPWWLILLIMALAVLVVWAFLSGRIFKGFSEQSTEKLVEQKLEACKTKGEKGKLDGTQYPDYDEDGLPDICDNCPKTPNFGDEVKDDDNDNFPALKDEKSKNWKICCGNDGKGDDDPKLDKKYCEDFNNDQKYGPSKLILSYLKP